MRKQKVTFEFPVTHDDVNKFCERIEFKVLFSENEPCVMIKNSQLEVDTTIGSLPLRRFVSDPDHKAIFAADLNGKQVAEQIKSLGQDKVYTMKPQIKLIKERDFAYIVWKVY